MSLHQPTERRNRWRGVLLGSASSFGARLIAVICGFVQVPLALQFLGAEAFGFWATLQALASLAIMLDFGTGYHLQNAASAANVHGRFTEIAGLLRATFWTGLSVAVVLVLVALILNSTWLLALFSLENNALRQDLTGGLVGLVTIIAAGIPVAIGQRLAIGLQQAWLVGIGQAIASVASLTFVILSARLQVSVSVFLAGTLAIPVLVNAGLFAVITRRLGLLGALARPPSAREWREGLHGGSLFFVTQLSATLRQSAPPFIIAATLGVAAVTPFNLVQRLLNLLAQPQLWLMEPLWAAYADARGRGDYAWIRQTLRQAFLASLVIAVLPIALSVWWGPRFLEWWTGHPLQDFPLGLLAGMAAWYALTALIQPISYFLNSLGRMQGQAIYGTATSVLGLALMAPACHAGGLALACVPFAVVVAGLNIPCAVADMRAAMRSWPAAPGSVTT